MKTLRFLGMAVVALLMTFVVASCGSDDDNSGNGLAGTSWKITKVDEISSEWHDDDVNSVFAFYADGTGLETRSTLKTKNFKWSMDGSNVLTLRWINSKGEIRTSDACQGTFAITGNTAVWTGKIDFDTSASGGKDFIIYFEKQ